MTMNKQSILKNRKQIERYIGLFGSEQGQTQHILTKRAVVNFTENWALLECLQMKMNKQSTPKKSHSWSKGRGGKKAPSLGIYCIPAHPRTKVTAFPTERGGECFATTATTSRHCQRPEMTHQHYKWHRNCRHCKDITEMSSMKQSKWQFVEMSGFEGVNFRRNRQSVFNVPLRDTNVYISMVNFPSNTLNLNV